MPSARDARRRRALPVSDDKISFEYKVKRFIEGSLMAPERAHVFWNGTFTDKQKAGLRIRSSAALDEFSGGVARGIAGTGTT